MARVRLEEVCKVYNGSVKAVKEFSLDIEDGEFVVLVGPSGCGKSTTLRMIAGLEEITSGKIYIGDKLVNDLEPKDRNIAMVFQNYALYPHMSVFDNLGYSLKCFHEKKDVIEKKVHEVAKMLDIEEYLERKPKELSGGQRQRVALGRCLIRNPQVFLFDEPLSNLDAKLRVQMRSEISRLHQKIGGTFIYVTHDQTEAMTMGDRIVVMKDGLIQQCDTPENLYEHPVNTFVATFLGSPQMNLFAAKIEGTKALLGKEGETPFSLTLDPSSFLKMEKEEEGKEVLVGIRPSDFLLGNKDDYDFRVSHIDLIEKLGNETLLYFSLPGREEATLASLRLQMSDELEERPYLKIERKHIHLFDKETGNSLMKLRDEVSLPVKVAEKEGKGYVLGYEYKDYASRLLRKSSSPSYSAELSVPTIAFHLERREGDYLLKAKVETLDRYSGYQACYLKTTEGNHLTIKTPLSVSLEEGKELDIYFNPSLGTLKENTKSLTTLMRQFTSPVEAEWKVIHRSTYLLFSNVDYAKKKYYQVEEMEQLKGEEKTLLNLKDNKGSLLTVLIPKNENLYIGQMVFCKKK